MSEWMASEDFFDLLKKKGAILYFTETTVNVEFPWLNVIFPRIKYYPHAEFKNILDKIPPLARLL